MPVKYKIETMKIGFGKEKKQAYVGRVQLGETVDTDMLVEQVHLRTGMTQAQIKMLLENLTESIKHFCKMGNGVRVGKLGIIKPSINTRSSESEDGVKITKKRFRYIPSSEMHGILDELELRKLSERSEEDLDDEEEDDLPDDEGGQDFT